jgi:hypothetical protein
MNALKPLLGALFLFFILKISAQGEQTTTRPEPFQIRGQLGISSIFYDVEGRTSNRKPFSWFVTGNPTLIIYGIEFPFAFSISEQNRSFRQPINRFGVSPRYKWATVHLGYRNLFFSPYSLGGHSIAGAGLEINPGKFRFAFMAGTFLRAVETIPTPLENMTESFLSTPAFKRAGWSMRVGFGDRENYTDLILLKAKDNPESIDPLTQPLFLRPAENALLAVTSRQRLHKNLTWELDIARSLYTADQNSGNDSIRGISLFKSLSFLSEPNESSRENMAFETAVIMHMSDFRVAGRFKRIDPDYFSMGTYYLQSDIQNITLEPSIDLWEKRINLGASFGFQKDNLKEDQVNQTNRFISSFSIAASPWNFYQLQIINSNYDLNQKSGTLPLDELNKISQTTSEWQIMQNLNFAGNLMVHQITGAYNTQKLKDRNTNTSELFNYTSSNLNLFYSLYFTKLFSGLQLGYSRMILETNDFNMLYRGPQLGISTQLLKNQLSLALTHTWYKQTMNDNDFGDYNNTRFRAQYTYQRSHRIGASLYRNKSNSLNNVLNPLEFRELKMDISYAFIF